MVSRFFLVFFSLVGCISSVQSQAILDIEKANSQALMTAQDVNHNAFSNITITNRTNQPVTVYGLYIVSYDVDDCSVCTGGVASGNNVLGTFVSPVFFRANQSVPIGQNYLYNMIYNGLYALLSSVAPPPCLLPGCSWPTDISTIKGWCLTIGAMSLNSNYTFSSYTKPGYPPASIVPFTQAVTSPPNVFNYNYALIDTSSFATGTACLGPIVCDDKSLTCSVSTPQSEAFQPY